MRTSVVSNDCFRLRGAVMRLAKPVGFALLVGVAGSLTACQATMLSDHRMTSSTSGVLGIPPEDLTISDRRSDSTNTYYIATTRSGKKYSCVISGGGLLAMGLTNPPSCNPVAQR